MKFEEYLAYFEDIIAHPENHPTYEKNGYYNYVKLNYSRTNRWIKRFEPNDLLKSMISSITEEQHWIVITEPWCGDAAHSVPQIYNIVKNNPAIDLEIQLRDSKPNLIEDYLTNGGKSIPKLIIRNDVGHDKAVWGPRPQKLQDIFDTMKAENASFDDILEKLQSWYNEDAGRELQEEIVQLFG